MKNKLQNKNLIKRAVALLAATSLVCTMQGGMSFLSKAEEEATYKTEQVAENRVLFESNYNGVADWNKYNNNHGWNTEWGRSLAGQLYTKNESGNGYLIHTQNTNNLGVIRLGHSYEESKKTDVTNYSYVKAVPGQTYRIEYDMFVYANEFAQSTEDRLKQGWPKDNNMEIGIAVGNWAADYSEKKYQDKQSYTSAFEVLETFAAGTNPDSKTWEGSVDGWVHRSYIYTVPADCNTSTYDALQIFVGNGSRCEVRFDNIKVTSAVLTTSEVLFRTDYEQANKGLIAVQNNNYYSRWAHTYKFSGDLRPGYLEDEKNTVLYYKQSNHGLGIVVLGHEYAGNQNQEQAAKDSAITVEKDATYLVTFDYKVKGKIGGSDLEIGLAIGKQSFDFGDSTPGGTAIQSNSEYISQYEVALTLAKNSEPVNEWKSQEVYITVPKDADVSTFNTLLLYAKNGNQTLVRDTDDNIIDYNGLFLDNITVKKVVSEESISTKDEVLFESDYDTVSNYTGYGKNAYSTKWSTKLSKQIFTQKDEKGNGYLASSQHEDNFGVIRLGHNYEESNKNNITDYNYVKAVPGQTYRIEYDMYVYANTFAQEKNKLNEGWPKSTAMDIGIAVGDKDADFSAVLYQGNDGYIKKYTSDSKILETFAVGTNPDSKTWEGSVDGWVHRSYIYTVPADCKTETCDALQLFVAYGSRCEVRFDNIKVTAQTAGVNVSYDVAGNVTNTYESSGYVPYTAMKNDNTAIRWYTDKEMTTPFLSTTYNRTGELTTVKLYGVKDNSEIAFMKGDANRDGKVDQEDIGALRTQLVTKVTDSARADMNGDSVVDVKDVVRSLKTQTGSIDATNVLIGNVAVSEYNVVIAGVELSDVIVSDRITILKKYVNAEDSKTNRINATLNEKLDTNFYVIEIGEGQVRVEGGSSNALAIALDTVISYIRAGVNMDQNCSSEFVYTGSSVPTVSSLVWAENF